MSLKSKLFFAVSGAVLFASAAMGASVRNMIEDMLKTPSSAYWSDERFTNFPLSPLPEPYYEHFAQPQKSKHIRIGRYYAEFGGKFIMELTNTSAMPIYGIAFRVRGTAYIDNKNHSWFTWERPWMPGERITLTGGSGYPSMYSTDKPLGRSVSGDGLWFEDLLIVFTDGYCFPSALQLKLHRPEKSNLPELYNGMRSGSVSRRDLNSLGSLRTYDYNGLTAGNVGDSIALYYYWNKERLYKVVVVFSKDHGFDEIKSWVEKTYGKLSPGKVHSNYAVNVLAGISYFSAIQFVGEFDALVNENDDRVVALMKRDARPTGFVKGSILFRDSKLTNPDQKPYHGISTNYFDALVKEGGSFNDLGTAIRFSDNINGNIGQWMVVVYDKKIDQLNILQYDFELQRLMERLRLGKMLDEAIAKLKRQAAFGGNGIHESDYPHRATGLLAMPKFSAAAQAELDKLPEKVRYPLALLAQAMVYEQEYRLTEKNTDECMRVAYKALFLKKYIKYTAPDLLPCFDDRIVIKNNQATVDDLLLEVIIPRYLKPPAPETTSAPADAAKTKSEDLYKLALKNVDEGNPIRALKHFAESADLGNPIAAYHVAHWLFQYKMTFPGRGDSTNADIVKYAEIAMRAEDSNVVGRTAFFLGCVYWYGGRGVEKDVEKAREYFLMGKKLDDEMCKLFFHGLIPPEPHSSRRISFGRDRLKYDINPFRAVRRRPTRQPVRPPVRRPMRGR